MHRSRRVPQDLEPSPLSLRLSVAGAADLTESNPGRCGFDLAGMGEALAAAATVEYEPEPLGVAAARQAVARYVQPWMPGATPGRVVLCASTSEAYTWCFKVACDPGDAVAVPAPSYPLLEVLANLEGVRLVRYRQIYDGGWRVDLHSLEAALDAGARAVVVVQPNSPTGAVLEPRDIEAVRARCADAGAMPISDEVFGPYGAGGARVPTLGGTDEDGPLTVVLDGLSKAAALPGVKLSWMVLSGSGVAELLPRLEWVADAFLSVSETAARALPGLLPQALRVQQQISARVMRNRQRLAHALAEVSAVDVLASDGGWYAVARVPRVLSDDELVTRLAERALVLTQPGYFYDFDREGCLVVSLLLPDELFAGAAKRLATELARL
jgi:aspartate/methionine/tyrosine aminotransferase